MRHKAPNIQMSAEIKSSESGKESPCDERLVLRIIQPGPH